GRGGVPGLRHAAAAADPHDDGGRGRRPPRQRPVPPGQHGPQGAGRDRLRQPQRRDRGDHLRHAPGGGPRPPQPARHADRAVDRHEQGVTSMTQVTSFRMVRDTYLDSMKLLVATSAMSEREDVGWAAAVMATPAGRERLAEAGFPVEELDGAGANDLVLAVRGDTQDAVEAALDAGSEAAFSGGDDAGGAGQEAPPRSI